MKQIKEKLNLIEQEKNDEEEEQQQQAKTLSKAQIKKGFQSYIQKLLQQKKNDQYLQSLSNQIPMVNFSEKKQGKKWTFLEAIRAYKAMKKLQQEQKLTLEQFYKLNFRPALKIEKNVHNYKNKEIIDQNEKYGISNSNIQSQNNNGKINEDDINNNDNQQQNKLNQLYRVENGKSRFSKVNSVDQIQYKDFFKKQGSVPDITYTDYSKQSRNLRNNSSNIQNQSIQLNNNFGNNIQQRGRINFVPKKLKMPEKKYNYFDEKYYHLQKTNRDDLKLKNNNDNN